MTKYKLEYIWLDGKKPVPELRGKTLIKSFEKPPTLADLPKWGFDGSSTMQAEGHSSDCVLKPVALYPDASRKNAYMVMSEVFHPDGTPHSTNARATIENDPDLWIGLEQEYFLYQGGRPLGFPENGYPAHPRARTTAASATNTWAAWRARSSRNIWKCASPPESTMRGSTRKSPRASGNSRSSPRARRKPPTTRGPRAT